MDLELFLDNTFAGDVFRAVVRYRLGDEVLHTLKFMTARVTGVVKVNGNKAKFLESVPIRLPVKESQSEVVYRCTIPGDALPSIKSFSFEINYLMIVEVYYSNVKTVETKTFEVYPVGLNALRCIMDGNRVIHNDMIRIDDMNDTAFSKIVKRLRNEFKCKPGTIEETAERKLCLLRDFEGFMNKAVEECKAEEKGDIYFYTSMNGLVVEGGMHRVTVYDLKDEISRIEHRKLFIEEDLLMISYKRNVGLTRIFIKVTEYVNGKVSSDTEELLEEFDSSMCTYKSIPILFDSKGRFSFDCVLFAVRFSYKIVFDHLEFILPINKIAPGTRMEVEQ